MRLLPLFALCLFTASCFADEKADVPVLLEAYYQELDGRPILTVMLTNTGKETVDVVPQWLGFQTRIAVFDADGKELLRKNKEKKSEELGPSLISLKSGRGLVRKIDLLEGHTRHWIGHGTMAKTYHHVPGLFPGMMELPSERLNEIHMIRIELLDETEASDVVIPFGYAVEYFYKVDTKKFNLFRGSRQCIDILLDGKGNRNRPVFGDWKKLPEREDSDEIKPTPPPIPVPKPNEP